MKQLKYLFFIIFALAFFNGSAQMYNFRTYSEDDGLPQSYIYHISQSKDGFLSLSTGEGFCMFDGNKFTTFTNKEIADNFVTTHFIDSRNIPWLGHSQNGISYLKDGKFNKLNNNVLGSFKVTQFGEDKRNQIWLSTAGGGFYLIDSSFKLKSVPCEEASNINSFVFDFQDRILAATNDGIYVLSSDSKKEDKTIFHFLKDRNIKQIIPSDNSAKAFWLIAEGDGIYGMKYENGRYVQFAHILNELNSESKNVSALFNDRSGNLWVSIFGEGLRKISFTGNSKTQFVVSTINTNNGLKNLYIQSIFQDFEGNMWFGTFGAGLIEKPLEKFTYYNSADGLTKNNVNAVVIDGKGKVWVGNENGLSSFDPSTKSSKVFGSGSGFINDGINALMLDETGYLWIGTNSNGIYTLNTGTLQFEDFSKRYSLPQLTVNTIICDKKKNIYIGTTEGMIVYNPSANLVKVLSTYEGLLHNNVLSLFCDSKERLWISSHGAPPYFLKDEKYTVFKDIEELKTFNINSVCEDKTGMIWIATEGDGVFKYNGRNFYNYKMQSGLLSNYCYGIITDDYNSVWVTHKIGLSEKKSFLKEFQELSTNEGMLFPENNLNAFYKDSIGNIWFGTTTGLVHYNSEIRKGSTVEPKLAIGKIVMNDISYKPVLPIKKKYGFYSVHIDFLAISLTNPEKIKYKYRLIGIDSIWKLTNIPFVDYPNLSDGEYKFQVMACNSEGLWTSSPKEIEIIIDEPVWKKVWFYVLLNILIGFVTYLIVHWRTRNLKKSQALLQQKVDEKTYLLQKEKEEVEYVKVELEHKNKDITDSINYARRIQDSLLPPEELLNELFKNKYFIFYKPKDIVSGDFYWAAPALLKDESKNLSLAAVADCTGHGVPGAFLSIMASNFLKQSLVEGTIQNTAGILNFLDENVASNLNQSSNNKQKMHDGMDLALIAIDYEKSKLHYSGANNPVYIFRKVNHENKMYILKSTKKAIGSGEDNDAKFGLQTFDLIPGDTIYLFSDGYADQFGGGNDKKLNYKRFKQVLSDAFELPISLQKEFLGQNFEVWKGETEQTDDVCIMGIKF